MATFDNNQLNKIITDTNNDDSIITTGAGVTVNTGAGNDTIETGVTLITGTNGKDERQLLKCHGRPKCQHTDDTEGLTLRLQAARAN